MSNLYPTNDYVLILPLENKPVSTSGILRVEGKEDTFKLGRVIGVGPGIYQNGTLIPTTVKLNQLVLFVEPPNARLTWDVSNLILLREPNIVATVEVK